MVCDDNDDDVVVVDDDDDYNDDVIVCWYRSRGGFAALVGDSAHGTRVLCE